MNLFHQHNWSEWEHERERSWLHYQEILRYCTICGEREYKLLSLFCPTKKRTGQYCHGCEAYGAEIESRIKALTIDKDIGILEQTMAKRTEIKADRNAKIYELYTEKGMTLEAIGNIYHISKERVRQIVDRWRIIKEQAEMARV